MRHQPNGHLFDASRVAGISRVCALHRTLVISAVTNIRPYSSRSISTIQTIEKEVPHTSSATVLVRNRRDDAKVLSSRTGLFLAAKGVVHQTICWVKRRPTIAPRIEILQWLIDVILGSIIGVFDIQFVFWPHGKCCYYPHLL